MTKTNVSIVTVLRWTFCDSVLELGISTRQTERQTNGQTASNVYQVMSIY